MIRFDKRDMQFANYPFSAASIYPEGKLPTEQIREILLKQMPPEIRTHAGEILFVPQVYQSELQDFAIRNGIPFVDRVDTWGLLLEEFLDTEFSDDTKKRTLDLLHQNGVRYEETVSIRQSVRDVMIAYNFTSMLWEWVHLGLYDLLQAYCGKLSGDDYRLSKEDFADFYWMAMVIGEKGQRKSGGT